MYVQLGDQLELVGAKSGPRGLIAVVNVVNIGVGDSEARDGYYCCTPLLRVHHNSLVLVVKRFRVQILP